MNAWEIVQHHITSNLPEYLIFVSALAVASVCTMPKKCPLLPEDHPLQEIWTWMRDSLQTAVPAARARNEAHSSSTVSTPTLTTTQEATESTAVDPTQPKK